ncbi:uncharacterized protein PG998_008282 [Apiospora kogelbergensis]|uniref:uncharacterized protein n=1 Tax=Apiospora kogelbergensis TaxID=1337665 RepID=UPI00312E43DD
MSLIDLTTEVSGPAEKHIAPAVDIYDEAVGLVAQIAAERTIHRVGRRPIIFVCHGFGGLLVKRALAYCYSRADHYRAVALCTPALLFLATPHHGVTKESLVLARTKHSGPSHLMLNLLEGSDMLQEITDQFAPLVKHFHISTFWETAPTRFDKGQTVVVHRDSAAPPGWADAEKCGISGTHSSIVKYSNTRSPGYKLVLAALDRSTSAAAETVSRRWRQETDIHLQQMRSEIAHLQTNLQESTESSRAESSDSVRQKEISADCTSPSPINVHYLVRRRSDFFVGRQEASNDLQRIFGNEICKKPKIFVIYGLPGSGKTQFCLKYLEDNWERYWGVFWVDCSSEANAESSYASISRHAGRGGEPGAGIQWLSQTSKPWLLVLDNANAPEMDLSAFLPRSGNGHILITTRNPDIKMFNTVGTLLFRGMDPEEAIILLLRLAYPDSEVHFVSQEYREPAKTIAMELGYLALALKQAATTIRQNLLPLEKYLKSLLMCRKSLLSRPTITCATEANIVATWELPFADITSRTTTRYLDAVDLIHLLAFMHFASIPHELFSRSSDNVKMLQQLGARIPMMVEPRSAQEVEDRVRQAARVLYEHSIISFANTEDSPISYAGTARSVLYLSLHPAIHQWARDRLNQEKQRNWLDCVEAIIASSFPSEMETSGAMFRRQLLPHIDACISFMESTYTILPTSPEQASNMEKFGLVYAENGFWRRAKALQQKVATYRKSHLGVAHPTTVFSQRALATTYWNLFEIQSCLEVQTQIRQALWWSRPSFKFWLSWPPWRPVHLHYLVNLDDLTKALWLAGMRGLSEMAGSRAVDRLTHLLGQDDPITLSAMFNLARTYLHVGRHEESYHMLSHVLHRRLHFFGPSHPDTLMAKNELGMNLCAQKTRLHEAQNLVLEVVEERKRVLGEEHAYTLWSINDLSKIHCELKQPEQAVVLLEDIVPIVERTLGPRHVGMTMTKSNLCRAYVLCDRLTEAAALSRVLLEIITPEHPDWVHAKWGQDTFSFWKARKRTARHAALICSHILRQQRSSNSIVLASLQ